jgi:poly(hydroxyalkanoate) depolymerase family esterase
MARLALRSGAKAMKMVARSARATRKKPGHASAVRAKAVRRAPAKRASPRRAATAPSRAKQKPLHSPASQASGSMAAGISGARRYRLFTPTGLPRNALRPLVVMLHGCGQDAQALAASSRMNRLAQREGFLVLYPEQDRLSHVQNCWNWYDTRSGRAQREADSIAQAVEHVCQTHAVDPGRVALMGLSAGAGLASLLALREPSRFQAVVMHSGVGAGLAKSSASALGAMRGNWMAAPLVPLADGQQVPALLVIQGSADPIVAPANGAHAAQRWADCEHAHAARPRELQRGTRYPVTVTDYRNRARLVSTLCLVHGLGHAWSGGAPGLAYSDPLGPDASRMAWRFMQKQFALRPVACVASRSATATRPC